MENNELIDHTRDGIQTHEGIEVYDGIQMSDHPLPGWWKWIFVGSIAFSVFYMLYYHIGAPGRSVLDVYETALDANTELQFGDMGDLQPTAETLATYAQREDKKGGLRMGGSVYKANCASCHGRDGEGKVGPNLTDQYFKHVRRIEDIARVVSNGAGNGAMPAWSERLHPTKLVLVSAYVASLRGTQPASEGKGPEGDEIAPWPEPPPPEAPAEPVANSDEG